MDRQYWTKWTSVLVYYDSFIGSMLINSVKMQKHLAQLLSSDAYHKVYTMDIYFQKWNGLGKEERRMTKAKLCPKSWYSNWFWMWQMIEPAHPLAFSLLIANIGFLCSGTFSVLRGTHFSPLLTSTRWPCSCGPSAPAMSLICDVPWVLVFLSCLFYWILILFFSCCFYFYSVNFGFYLFCY